MNNENGYDDYNVFIRQCVRQLIEDRVCYCYNIMQVKDIQKRFNNKDLQIMKNECGFTLSVPRKKVKK